MRAPVVSLRGSLLALSGGLGAGGALALLAVKTSPLMAAGVLGGLVVAAAVFAWPFLGFLMTAFVVPLERIGRLTNDSAVTTISLMRIVGTLSLGAVLFQAVIRRRGLWTPKHFWLYLGYFGFLVISVVNHDSMREGIRGVSSMLANVMFLLLVFNSVRNRAQIKLAIIAWLVSTVGIGVFTIYQYHADAAVTEDQNAATGMRTTDERFSTVLHDSAEYELLGNNIKRAIGSTSNAAVYGINLILALPFYFWLLHRERRWWVILLLLASAAIVAYNTLLTNTRAVVATMLFSLLLCLVTGVARVRKEIWVGLLIGFVAIIPMIPPEIYERALTVSNYTVERSASLRYRFTYWETALELISRNFWTGVGAGNQSIIPKTVRNVRMAPNASAHNEYLNSLMEVGIFGYMVLIAFFWAIWSSLRQGAKRFAQLGDRDGAVLMRCIMISFLSVLFFALQADVMHFPLKGWWLAVGLGVVLERMSRMAAAAPPPGSQGSPA